MTHIDARDFRRTALQILLVGAALLILSPLGAGLWVRQLLFVVAFVALVVGAALWGTREGLDVDLDRGEVVRWWRIWGNTLPSRRALNSPRVVRLCREHRVLHETYQPRQRVSVNFDPLPFHHDDTLYVVRVDRLVVRTLSPSADHDAYIEGLSIARALAVALGLPLRDEAGLEHHTLPLDDTQTLSAPPVVDEPEGNRVRWQASEGVFDALIPVAIDYRSGPWADAGEQLVVLRRLLVGALMVLAVLTPTMALLGLWRVVFGAGGFLVVVARLYRAILRASSTEERVRASRDGLEVSIRWTGGQDQRYFSRDELDDLFSSGDVLVALSEHHAVRFGERLDADERRWLHAQLCQALG